MSDRNDDGGDPPQNKKRTASSASSARMSSLSDSLDYDAVAMRLYGIGHFQGEYVEDLDVVHIVDTAAADDDRDHVVIMPTPPPSTPSEAGGEEFHAYPAPAVVVSSTPPVRVTVTPLDEVSTIGTGTFGRGTGGGGMEIDRPWWEDYDYNAPVSPTETPRVTNLMTMSDDGYERGEASTVATPPPRLPPSPPPPPYLTSGEDDSTDIISLYGYYNAKSRRRLFLCAAFLCGIILVTVLIILVLSLVRIRRDASVAGVVFANDTDDESWSNSTDNSTLHPALPPFLDEIGVPIPPGFPVAPTTPTAAPSSPTFPTTMMDSPTIGEPTGTPPTPTQGMPTQSPTKQPVTQKPTQAQQPVIVASPTPPTKSPVNPTPAPIDKPPTRSPVNYIPTRVPTRSPVNPPPTRVPTRSPVNPPPTRVPTRSPVNPPPTPAPQAPQPTAPNDLSPSVNSPTVTTPRSGNGIPSYPEFRYKLWNDLDADVRQIYSSNLGYDEGSWNEPGSFWLEHQTFWYIQTQLPSRIIDTVTLEMGFTEVTWDCWINHYSDYRWFELDDIPTSSTRSVLDELQTLGWTKWSWRSDHQSDWPDSEFKDWIELTTEERISAEHLCYTKELWDDIPLPQWEKL